MSNKNGKVKVVLMVVLFGIVFVVMFVTNNWIKRELEESDKAAVSYPQKQNVVKEKPTVGEDSAAQQAPVNLEQNSETKLAASPAQTDRPVQDPEEVIYGLPIHEVNLPQ